MYEGINMTTRERKPSSNWQLHTEDIITSPETDAQFQFTGIKKCFNSYTLKGGMNCILATQGGTALMILYFRVRSKNSPAVKVT
ncbi:ATP synthase membrane subunit K, mitochondrial-like [Ctenodactylus gundi]